MTGGNHGLAQSGDGCHGHHHQHQVDVYLVTKMSDNMCDTCLCYVLVQCTADWIICYLQLLPPSTTKSGSKVKVILSLV